MKQTEDKTYYKKITSDHRLFDLKLKEVWQYRELIVMLAKRNLRVRYMQTVLGPAWLVLSPLISALIYSFVFGGIAGIGTEGLPKLLFYLSGHALWSLFAECLNRNSNVFTVNANLYGKVYFPRLVIPAANALTALAEYTVRLLLVGCFMVYYAVTGAITIQPQGWLLMLLLPLLPAVMGTAVGLCFSASTTKYKDLAILVTFVVQLWMYVTPVIYPLSTISETGLVRTVLSVNPMTAPVEYFRVLLLGTGTQVPLLLIWSFVFTAIVLLLGIIAFNKAERTFIDTV